MNRATATTTAKAVRQHGSGLVHATQPRAALRGRQQCPSGGVKKSLCCAAAGINALDLQATAALAYPMTGVRQAQKLSTPLRSHVRPPAQLVEGGKHSLKALDRLKRIGSQVEKQTRSLAIIHLLTLIYLEEAFDAAAKRNHGIDKADVGQAHRINGFNGRQSIISGLNAPTLRHVANQIGRLDAEVKYERSLMSSLRNKLHRPNHHCSPLLLSTLLACPLIPYGIESCQHGGKASHCLSPIGGALRHPPIMGGTEYQPKQAATDQKYPKSPKTPLLHLLGNFKPRHPQLLRSETKFSSLPTPFHHVQRGAA